MYTGLALSSDEHVLTDRGQGYDLSDVLISGVCDLLTLCSPTLFLTTCLGVRESQSQLVTSQISDLKLSTKPFLLACELL